MGFPRFIRDGMDPFVASLLGTDPIVRIMYLAGFCAMILG